jgi:hypothetical protein
MELGKVIAQRVFDRSDGGVVVVSIGAPQPFEDGRDFYCPYQIEGLSAPRESRAGGVDGIQALTLALQKVATDLYLSEEWKSGTLRYLGSRDLDLQVASVIADIAPAKT